MTKNDIIMRYNKFSNLEFTPLIFPIWKALGPLPKIEKKIPEKVCKITQYAKSLVFFLP